MKYYSTYDLIRMGFEAGYLTLYEALQFVRTLREIEQLQRGYLMGLLCDRDSFIGGTAFVMNDNPQRRWYVNAYEQDRAYGGPEEGGWWFDWGTPLASIPVHNLEEAKQAYDLLYDRLSEEYDDGRDIHSVLHSGSLAIRTEIDVAEMYPEETPRYEQYNLQCSVSGRCLRNL